MSHVAVVGAGIAGLTCAWELTKAGVAVDLYERASSVGGRMRTRTREHLAFDLGANFLVQAYDNVCGLAREMQVPLRSVGPVDHVMYRRGQPHLFHFSSAVGLFRSDCLSLWSRLRLLGFLARMRNGYPLMDFFDLSSVPAKFNLEDAYSTATHEAGHEFADYLVDAFNSCMMFYRAREISAAAFLSLFRMMAGPGFDFGIVHAQGGMQGLADSIAGRVNVRTGHAVTGLRREGSSWRVTLPNASHLYDRVVLATTAGPALALVPPDLERHRAVLSDTRYACTINVALRLPKDALGRIHCFYVPFLESSIVSEFTNEALKGDHTSFDGWSLVNVGLHEEAALSLLHADDETIFETVRQEILRLVPGLLPSQLKAYDLERWTEAIPKYDCSQLNRVRCFQAQGQGEAGLYLCGDYLNAPWLEGASRSGKRVAITLIDELRSVALESHTCFNSCRNLCT